MKRIVGLWTIGLAFLAFSGSAVAVSYDCNFSSAGVYGKDHTVVGDDGKPTPSNCTLTSGTVSGYHYGVNNFTVTGAVNVSGWFYLRAASIDIQAAGVLNADGQGELGGSRPTSLAGAMNNGNPGYDGIAEFSGGEGQGGSHSSAGVGGPSDCPCGCSSDNDSWCGSGGGGGGGGGGGNGTAGCVGGNGQPPHNYATFGNWTHYSQGGTNGAGGAGGPASSAVNPASPPESGALDINFGSGGGGSGGGGTGLQGGGTLGADGSPGGGKIILEAATSFDLKGTVRANGANGVAGGIGGSTGSMQDDECCGGWFIWLNDCKGWRNAGGGGGPAGAGSGGGVVIASPDIKITGAGLVSARGGQGCTMSCSSSSNWTGCGGGTCDCGAFTCNYSLNNPGAGGAGRIKVFNNPSKYSKTANAYDTLGCNSISATVEDAQPSHAVPYVVFQAVYMESGVYVPIPSEANATVTISGIDYPFTYGDHLARVMMFKGRSYPARAPITIISGDTYQFSGWYYDGPDLNFDLRDTGTFSVNFPAPAPNLESNPVYLIYKKGGGLFWRGGRGPGAEANNWGWTQTDGGGNVISTNWDEYDTEGNLVGVALRIPTYNGTVKDNVTVFDSRKPVDADLRITGNAVCNNLTVYTSPSHTMYWDPSQTVNLTVNGKLISQGAIVDGATPPTLNSKLLVYGDIYLDAGATLNLTNMNLEAGADVTFSLGSQILNSGDTYFKMFGASSTITDYSAKLQITMLKIAMSSAAQVVQLKTNLGPSTYGDTNHRLDFLDVQTGKLDLNGSQLTVGSQARVFTSGQLLVSLSGSALSALRIFGAGTYAPWSSSSPLVLRTGSNATPSVLSTGGSVRIGPDTGSVSVAANTSGVDISTTSWLAMEDGGILNIDSGAAEGGWDLRVADPVAGGSKLTFGGGTQVFVDGKIDLTFGTNSLFCTVYDKTFCGFISNTATTQGAIFKPGNSLAQGGSFTLKGCTATTCRIGDRTEYLVNGDVTWSNRAGDGNMDFKSDDVTLVYPDNPPGTVVFPSAAGGGKLFLISTTSANCAGYDPSCPYTSANPLWRDCQKTCPTLSLKTLTPLSSLEVGVLVKASFPAAVPPSFKYTVTIDGGDPNTPLAPGKLVVPAGGTLKLGNGPLALQQYRGSLEVNGILEVVGKDDTAPDPNLKPCNLTNMDDPKSGCARITSTSPENNSYYNITVFQNGLIRARRALFEYLAEQGVTVRSGAFVDVASQTMAQGVAVKDAKDFTSCIFRKSITPTDSNNLPFYMLTIENNQELIIDGVRFLSRTSSPSFTLERNLRKAGQGSDPIQGRILLMNERCADAEKSKCNCDPGVTDYCTGDLGGRMATTYAVDPGHRLHWTVSPTPVLTNVRELNMPLNSRKVGAHVTVDTSGNTDTLLVHKVYDNNSGQCPYYDTVDSAWKMSAACTFRPWLITPPTTPPTDWNGPSGVDLMLLSEGTAYNFKLSSQRCIPWSVCSCPTPPTAPTCSQAPYNGTDSGSGISYYNQIFTNTTDYGPCQVGTNCTPKLLADRTPPAWSPAGPGPVAIAPITLSGGNKVMSLSWSAASDTGCGSGGCLTEYIVFRGDGQAVGFYDNGGMTPPNGASPAFFKPLDGAADEFADGQIDPDLWYLTSAAKSGGGLAVAWAEENGYLRATAAGAGVAPNWNKAIVKLQPSPDAKYNGAFTMDNPKYLLAADIQKTGAVSGSGLERSVGAVFKFQKSFVYWEISSNMGSPADVYYSKINFKPCPVGGCTAAETALMQQTAFLLTQGNWHRLMVYVNGNLARGFVDNLQLWELSFSSDQTQTGDWGSDYALSVKHTSLLIDNFYAAPLLAGATPGNPKADALARDKAGPVTGLHANATEANNAVVSQSIQFPQPASFSNDITIPLPTASQSYVDPGTATNTYDRGTGYFYTAMAIDRSGNTTGLVNNRGFEDWSFASSGWQRTSLNFAIAYEGYASGDGIYPSAQNTLYQQVGNSSADPYFPKGSVLRLARYFRVYGGSPVDVYPAVVEGPGAPAPHPQTAPGAKYSGSVDAWTLARTYYQTPFHNEDTGLPKAYLYAASHASTFTLNADESRLDVITANTVAQGYSYTELQYLVGDLYCDSNSWFWEGGSGSSLKIVTPATLATNSQGMSANIFRTYRYRSCDSYTPASGETTNCGSWRGGIPCTAPGTADPVCNTNGKTGYLCKTFDTNLNYCVREYFADCSSTACPSGYQCLDWAGGKYCYKAWDISCMPGIPRWSDAAVVDPAPALVYDDVNNHTRLRAEWDTGFENNPTNTGFLVYGFEANRQGMCVDGNETALLTANPPLSHGYLKADGAFDAAYSAAYWSSSRSRLVTGLDSHKWYCFKVLARNSDWKPTGLTTDFDRPFSEHKGWSPMSNALQPPASPTLTGAVSLKYGVGGTKAMIVDGNTYQEALFTVDDLNSVSDGSYHYNDISTIAIRIAPHADWGAAAANGGQRGDFRASCIGPPYCAQSGCGGGGQPACCVDMCNPTGGGEPSWWIYEYDPVGTGMYGNSMVDLVTDQSSVVRAGTSFTITLRWKLRPGNGNPLQNYYGADQDQGVSLKLMDQEGLLYDWSNVSGNCSTGQLFHTSYIPQAPSLVIPPLPNPSDPDQKLYVLGSDQQNHQANAVQFTLVQSNLDYDRAMVGIRTEPVNLYNWCSGNPGLCAAWGLDTNHFNCRDQIQITDNGAPLRLKGDYVSYHVGLYDSADNGLCDPNHLAYPQKNGAPDWDPYCEDLAPSTLCSDALKKKIHSADGYYNLPADLSVPDNRYYLCVRARDQQDYRTTGDVSTAGPACAGTFPFCPDGFACNSGGTCILTGEVLSRPVEVIVDSRIPILDPVTACGRPDPNPDCVANPANCSPQCSPPDEDLTPYRDSANKWQTANQYLKFIWTAAKRNPAPTPLPDDATAPVVEYKYILINPPTDPADPNFSHSPDSFKIDPYGYDDAKNCPCTPPNCSPTSSTYCYKTQTVAPASNETGGTKYVATNYWDHNFPQAGMHLFGVQAKDKAGNKSFTQWFTIGIDVVSVSKPCLTSRTHPKLPADLPENNSQVYCNLPDVDGDQDNDSGVTWHTGQLDAAKPVFQIVDPVVLNTQQMNTVCGTSTRNLAFSKIKAYSFTLSVAGTIPDDPTDLARQEERKDSGMVMCDPAQDPHCCENCNTNYGYCTDTDQPATASGQMCRSDVFHYTFHDGQNGRPTPDPGYAATDNLHHQLQYFLSYGSLQQSGTFHFKIWGTTEAGVTTDVADYRVNVCGCFEKGCKDAGRTRLVDESGGGKGGTEGMTYYSGGPFTWQGASGSMEETRVMPFFLDQTEVSNADYQSCAREFVCMPPAAGQQSSNTRPGYYADPAFADYPVVNVTWDMAQTYCDWVGKRLPAELEWDFAGQAAMGSRAGWRLANPVNNDLYRSRDTVRVSERHELTASRDLVVYNLFNNVSEWVNDWWAPKGMLDYAGLPDGPAGTGVCESLCAANGAAALTDPHPLQLAATVAPPPAGASGNSCVETCNRKVVRGDSFLQKEIHLDDRGAMAPGAAAVNVGFRCALDASPSVQKRLEAGFRNLDTILLNETPAPADAVKLRR